MAASCLDLIYRTEAACVQRGCQRVFAAGIPDNESLDVNTWTTQTLLHICGHREKILPEFLCT